LFRAKLRDVLWIERPGLFSTSHLATTLKKAGQNITPHEADLSRFDMSSLLQNGSHVGADRATAVAFQVAATIPAGTLALICSRVIDRSTEMPMKRRLQQQCLMRAGQTTDVRNNPSLRWRIPFYLGQEHRFRATFFLRNIAALYFCRRAAYEAGVANDSFGEIVALCGTGESVDMLGLGVLPIAYRAGLRFCFRPALLVVRRAKRTPNRKTTIRLVAQEQLVEFHIARAYFATGRLGKAALRMRWLAQRGVSSFIRGHCHRFLALYYASTGHFDEARTAIEHAFEQFHYLEMDIEAADTMRNRAAVELLERKFPDAIKSTRDAIAKYRKGGVRRGEVRARALLAIIRACQRLPLLLSSRIVRRIATGL
jgi:hypothetical protein